MPGTVIVARLSARSGRTWQSPLGSMTWIRRRGTRSASTTLVPWVSPRPRDAAQRDRVWPRRPPCWSSLHGAPRRDLARLGQRLHRLRWRDGSRCLRSRSGRGIAGLGPVAAMAIGAGGADATVLAFRESKTQSAPTTDIPSTANAAPSRAHGDGCCEARRKVGRVGSPAMPTGTSRWSSRRPARCGHREFGPLPIDQQRRSMPLIASTTAWAAGGRSAGCLASNRTISSLRPAAGRG